jgi:sigma-E factor negative regulatory protein RseB
MVSEHHPNRAKYLLLLNCLLVISLPAQPLLASESDQANLWLDKMATAVREQTYDGIFTYMRGHDLDTVRIVHSYSDGKEIERLVHLNGEPREVIRTNDEVICHHANEDGADLNHGVALGPFSRAFSDNISALQNYYRFSLQGKDRVAGRGTIRLNISPKHTDRYGYKLWLDDQTGLLLQSRLVYKGRVLEVFQFSRVEIGEPIGESELISSIGDDSLQHELTPQLAQEENGRADWRVAWLPAGFKRSINVQRGQNSVLFTDGIATFSVFVEKQVNARLSNLSTRMGGTVVISRRLRGSGQQITVVGELPIKIAQKVADNIEPVIY